MKNKYSGFLSAGNVMLIFLFVHFIFLFLSLTLGRFADKNILIRYAAKYQAYLFTQNHKLFAFPPFKVRLWVRTSRGYVNKSNGISFINEATRVGTYNVIHYLLSDTTGKEAYYFERLLLPRIDEECDAVFIMNHERACRTKGIYFFREQKTYIWHVVKL
ncbi:MAG: hypothetical protein N3F09_08480 [Bacteroidia bacterium]|nr:hypothetical protein [Bacteroidia bacterium]